MASERYAEGYVAKRLNETKLMPRLNMVDPGESINLHVNLSLCCSLTTVQLGVCAVHWATATIQQATETIRTLPKSVRELVIVIDTFRRYPKREVSSYTRFTTAWPAMWRAIATKTDHVHVLTLRFSANERSSANYARHRKSDIWEVGLYATARTHLHQQGFKGGEYVSATSTVSR